MATSSLLGAERPAEYARGRDEAALGTGEDSDSGSDRVGIDDGGSLDDALAPVDVVLRDDTPHGPLGSETMPDREAPDIGVDRVFSPATEVGPDGDLDEIADEDEDPDLAFVDEAVAGDETETPDLPGGGRRASGGSMIDEDDNIPGADPDDEAGQSDGGDDAEDADDAQELPVEPDRR